MIEFLAVILFISAVLIIIFSRKSRKFENYKNDNFAGIEENSPRIPKRHKNIAVKPKKQMVVVSGPAHVIDGDTVVIQKTQVRLFGIDAPELDHPYGQKSKWALISLCKGQRIQAKIEYQDNHGRTVARCYLPDGRDLSAEMVKLGMAIDWTKFSGGEYRALEAPNVRKKLWLADARQKGQMHVWENFDKWKADRGKQD